MLIKIGFFAIATTTAFLAAAFSAAAIMFIGYLTNMPLGATMITAAPLGIAVFGITIAIFSMASSLFFTGSKSNPTPDRKSGES